MSQRIIICVLVTVLMSCGGGGSQSRQLTVEPEEVINPDLKILMMGNSHTTPIPTLLRQIFHVANPELRVQVTQAPGGMFLIERMGRTFSHRITAAPGK